MSINSPGNVPISTSEAFVEAGRDTAQELKAEQTTAQASAAQTNATTTFRALSKTEQKKPTERAKNVSKTAKMKKEKQLLPVGAIKDEAQGFKRNHEEHNAQTLTNLRLRIKPGMSKEQILEVLKEFTQYAKDPFLADQALDFLKLTTDGDLLQEVEAAKQEHHDINGREIIAGQNITSEARKAAEKGLGTRSSMRDLYYDITGNPRDTQTLFRELSQKYDYKELNKVIKYLHHSLGADLKSGGPSIPRGELHRLISETRSLQAILGVYRFYSQRMGLVTKMFKQAGLDVPAQLNFESMAKAFMRLTNERYPTGDKVLSEAKNLGIESHTEGKIAAFSQFRDSVRQFAMSQIYRSLQHRDDLMKAIIDALDELEDQYEQELENEGYEEYGDESL